MGRHTHRVAAILALAATATIASAAEIKWNVNANGNWGIAENWSPQQVPQAGDDVVFDGVAIGQTAHRDITLGADRTVNSLRVRRVSTSTGYVFRVIDNNHTLTLQSGNIYMDGDATNPNSALEIRSALQIGNGIVPVEDAVWTSFNTANRGLDISGPLSAIAGTKITLTGVEGAGNPIVTLRNDNSNFLGTFIVDSPGNFVLRVEGPKNTLGAGTIIANTLTYISDVSGSDVLSASQVANIEANADVYITSANASNPDSIRTYEGTISGNGALKINQGPGVSTAWLGTVQFTGNNTHSGEIEIKFGTLQVDGVWTGGGNVKVNASTSANRPVGLAGSGQWGLGSGNSIALNGTAVNAASLAPGTLGTIGTLTVGTDESNSLVFGTNSVLNIDIDGASADQLVINGNLDLSGNSDAIAFNILSAPTSVYTLITYTGILTGTFDDEVGLPEGYSLDYSTPGQINLVPEPAALGLLSLGGLALLRRRRS